MDALVLKDSITGGMTDEEFLKFCLGNPGLRIERNSNLEIIIMSPVSTLSGLHSSEVFGQLFLWSKSNGRGIAFDASVGFTLPDRSVLSPDASWVSNEKWNALTEEEQDTFASISPEFVIEVRSKSDDLEDLKNKMTVWIKNGVLLAWLIDPRNRSVYIYRTGKKEEVIGDFNQKVVGESPVNGFELDLSRLKV